MSGISREKRHPKKSAFSWDMKTGGPYFSQALFNTILSHSVRWCRDEPGMEQLLAPYDDGAAFSANAVRYLFEDIQQGRNGVPTVQALLLLSAQECGRGDRTQAWLYSGMAFRLTDDMGICVDGRRHEDAEKYSIEDLEIRNRLFWSCYFWDKLISLYFGRIPLIQNSAMSPPRILMDDTAEIEAWTPHGLLSPDYLPKQAHVVSCFVQMCALAEVLNRILKHLYSPSLDLRPSESYQSAVREGSRLRDWWRDLPSHLKIDLSASSLECPPSHVVVLNCFYHAVNILLHRAKLKLSRHPELASTLGEQNPLVHCISSASSIIALFGLYTSAFGEGHVVLCLAYSVYTAASIFLLEVRATGHAAAGTMERLSLCAGALKRLTRTNPVIAKASGVIEREMETLGLHASSAAVPHQTHHLTSQQPLVSVTEASSAPAFANWQPFEPDAQHEDSILLDPSYLGGDVEGSMSLNLLDMPPEMFEAFTHIEPISITMNPGSGIS
ncbi:hypothetical protein E8E11_006813 [Didymella keratinophila]|nr:hypothetical protein E8E11_006813 [Didymella keratinophila]